LSKSSRRGGGSASTDTIRYDTIAEFNVDCRVWSA